MAAPQRVFQARAPIKGAFPLDHEGLCKAEMLQYMICIQDKAGVSANCRPLAQAYFHCRMRNGLMEEEEWRKLGFPSHPPEQPPSSSTSPHL